MCFKPIIICFWVIGAFNIWVNQGWRGLVPLHSTRADVERLLGPPRATRGVASRYETQNERVLVFYSGEPCKKGEEWNVPRDTVVSFTISPSARTLVGDLKLDQTQYKRMPDYHVQGIIYYFNREEGIRISARGGVGQEEFIDNISYEPVTKDNYLRCPDATPLTDSNVEAPPPYKFDQYSSIRISDEKARLDNFAIYLHQHPKLIGYIITYGGKRGRSNEAKVRAERAKNHLVNRRNIGPERIVTLDGGYRETPQVELYALPQGIRAPTPSPTVGPKRSAHYQGQE